MKKTYISPGHVVVEFSAKSAILQMSINSKQVSASDAGWAKEYGNSSSDGGSSSGNVWDEEW